MGFLGFGAVTGEIFLDCKGPTKPQSRLPAYWPVWLAQPGPLLRSYDSTGTQRDFAHDLWFLEGSLGCKELSVLPSQEGSSHYPPLSWASIMGTAGGEPGAFLLLRSRQPVLWAWAGR